MSTEYFYNKEQNIILKVENNVVTEFKPLATKLGVAATQPLDRTVQLKKGMTPEQKVEKKREYARNYARKQAEKKRLAQTGNML